MDERFVNLEKDYSSISSDTILIYQIGRIDTNFQNRITFDIEGEKYNCTLSSLALKEYFQKQKYNVKLKLLFPVSLPFNGALYKNESFKRSCPDDFYNLLSDAFSKVNPFLDNPNNVFEKHPHLRPDIEFLVLPSMGSYKAKNEVVDFKCHYSDIVLIILFDMIKSFLENNEKVSKIIIDISSGHNYYVSAMIEALKYLDTWINLYMWQDNKSSCYICVSDPIIPDFSGPYKIFFEKQNTRAFFSSPIHQKDIENTNLAKKIFPDKSMRRYKNRLHEILETFGLIFSSIKNNAPLFIYMNRYHNKKFVKFLLVKFLDYTNSILLKKYTETPNLDKNSYIKIFFSVAFYMGLIDKLKRYNINKAEQIEIDTFCNCVRSIYHDFGLLLADTILGNEVNRIKDSIKNNCSSNLGWTKLAVIFYGSAQNNPQKRNFFAHAGLESNITECCISGNQIYIKYDLEHKNTIRNWLKEAI